MKINMDLHLHSNYSCDSKETIDNMCQAAILKGFKYICFTEHFDMNPKDYGYNYYKHNEYTNELIQAKNKYADRLVVLQGIEFSEPHLYQKDFEKILKYDFDFVLGSVHWLGESWVGDNEFQKRYSIEDIYEMHYEQIMKAIAFGGFDSIAHIDFPKRYLMKVFEPIELIEEIVIELIKKKIVLEINSSPIRRGYDDLFPSDTIIKLYVKHGGNKVTIGSDAHGSEEIGQDFNEVFKKIGCYKLTPVIFQKRKELKTMPQNIFWEGFG